MRWHEVDLPQRNGIIRGYRVTLTDTERQKLISNELLNETTLSIEFFDLLPYYPYKVSVTAFNNKGIGPASSVVALTSEEGREIKIYRNHDNKVWNCLDLLCRYRYWNDTSAT